MIENGEGRHLESPCGCPHPPEVHADDLGCWLCDCTYGQVVKAAPEPTAPVAPTRSDRIERRFLAEQARPLHRPGHHN